MSDFKESEHYKLLERASDIMSDWQTVGDDVEDRQHVYRKHEAWQADYYDWEEALHTHADVIEEQIIDAQRSRIAELEAALEWVRVHVDSDITLENIQRAQKFAEENWSDVKRGLKHPQQGGEQDGA